MFITYCKRIMQFNNSFEKQSDKIVNSNFTFDIGLYVRKDIDYYVKWNLFSTPWKPNHNYSLPYSLK